jgi:hypothetical protein
MFTNIKVVAIFAIGSALFFGIFVFSRFLTAGQSIEFWIGILIGSGLGVLTCTLLVLDMKSSKKASHQKTPSHPKWMPISVIGGILLSHFVIDFFTSEMEMLITNVVLSWFIVTISFLGLLVLLKAGSKKGK